MSADIEQRIREILADILGLDPARIGDDAELGTTPGWDSANHITLVLSLEDEFSIALEAADIDTMITFSDVVRTVEGKL